MPDLTSSLLDGTLKYQLTELAALPRAAVVVEGRYSQIFALTHPGPQSSPTGWPSCRSPSPACRSCSARPASSPRSTPTATWPPGHTWVTDSADTAETLGRETTLTVAPAQPTPSTAEVRAWARHIGLSVPDRGRLRPEIWQAWHDAHHPA